MCGMTCLAMPKWQGAMVQEGQHWVLNDASNMLGLLCREMVVQKLMVALDSYLGWIMPTTCLLKWPKEKDF